MAQFGDYELVEKIGEGGMAMVYKAVQGSLGRAVAIKVLSRTLIEDPEIVERFIRESVIIARLNHPNIIQMCKALAYAHKNGVIHLDIKPANILIDTEGNVMVADFGIAHLFGGAEAAQSAPVMGTPSYMSPEQKAGTDAVTIAKMLAPDPADRYESFDEILPLIDDLLKRADEYPSDSLRSKPQKSIASRIGLSRLSGAVGSFVRDALR